MNFGFQVFFESEVVAEDAILAHDQTHENHYDCKQVELFWI